MCGVRHHNAGLLLRFGTGSQVSSGRLQSVLPAPWRSTGRAARLMHYFRNVQGQVLHLVQGETCLFNYADDLIVLYGRGSGLREREREVRAVRGDLGAFEPITGSVLSQHEAKKCHPVSTIKTAICQHVMEKKAKTPL